MGIEEIKDPKWLSFLKDFAEKITKISIEDELDETIVWTVKQINDKTTCISIKFISNDTSIENHVFAEYYMFLSKRYFHTNMIRIINADTNKEVCMEADPRLVLSYLFY